MSLPIPSFSLVFFVVSVALAWWIWNKFLILRPFDNVRGPGSASWLKGNRAQIWHPTGGIKFMQDITQQYGGVVRLEGVFGVQELFVSDPLALNSISVNDTSIWQLPAEVLATNVVLFGEGLPGTTGEAHRKHRKELNPVFSKAHIRELTPVFYSVGKQLCEAISAIVKAGPQEIDMLPWTARVSLELIGQGGLGYSFDKLTENKPDEYASAVKDLLPLLFQNPVARALAPFFPLPLRRLLAKITPSRSLQALVRIIHVMELSSKKVLHSKRTAMENGEEAEQIGGGKDLMSALLRAHLQHKGANPVPESHLLGHINALIFGAVDTTSSALTRMLHILAQYPDVQTQIRKESSTMCERLGTEDLPFDTLSEMPYIDAFLREILRLYAPVPVVLRCAVKDTVLPLYNPTIGKDGHEIKEIAVPAGTTVFASLLIPNISTDIWGEDAMQFKPERWLSPLPGTVANARLPGIYSHLMSFWGGGSACLFQFSQLELKIIILLVLKSFRLSLSDKEVAWRASGLQFPSLSETGSLGLPLIVEAL